MSSCSDIWTLSGVCLYKLASMGGNLYSPSADNNLLVGGTYTLVSNQPSMPYLSMVVR